MIFSRISKKFDLPKHSTTTKPKTNVRIILALDAKNKQDIYRMQLKEPIKLLLFNAIYCAM